MASSERKGLSLRFILAVCTIGVVALALLVAGALVSLTTLLHQTTSNAAASAERVHLAQEAEVDLLLHSRVNNALLKRDIQERLASRLGAMKRLPPRPNDHAILAEAESQVAFYIFKSSDPSTPARELETHLVAAYGALEALVDANVVAARESHALATLWDRRANYVGLGASAFLVVAGAGLLLWLERRAFSPILSLVDAMERFGRGDREARAPEDGPAELQDIGRRFNEMAAALRMRRQAQIAFLGGVAHDIRNPLSVLRMSVALIPAGKPLPPEPRIRHIIEKIDRQITRLDRMAGDFLDITNIEAGELELKMDLHDARDLVAAVAHLFEGTSPEPRLVVTVPGEAVEVYCDQLRMEQVLTNLISNAIKYSPADSPIEIALEPTPEEVVFRVTDRGVGIPQAEHSSVFEPFRRTGLSKETVPGVGLGLFVVKRIVEAHGGRIQVQSSPGVGSTFQVHLVRFGGVSA